jgi:uncharacterized protein YjbJ (UPF0337 family)
MNWDELQGSWAQVKGKLREEWGKLTDQDVENIGGKKDQLVGALAERYGMEKEKASLEIDRWVATVRDKIAGKDEPKPR